MFVRVFDLQSGYDYCCRLSGQQQAGYRVPAMGNGGSAGLRDPVIHLFFSIFRRFPAAEPAPRSGTRRYSDDKPGLEKVWR